MNVFKELVLSIWSYKSYSEFLKNKKTKVFGFALVLMLFYFLITMVVPFVKFQITTGGFDAMIEEYVPEFELKYGILWVDEVYEIEEDHLLLYIDTDPEYSFYDAEEMEEYLYVYSQALLMDSEKLIYKDDDGEVMGLYYSDIGLNCSKDTLLELVPMGYVAVVIYMILAYCWMTALFFFGVLFVALLGMIAASCMRKELTFGQLYIMSVYSRTLPLIIKAVVKSLSLTVPFFFIINFGISLAIIIAAIQRMKEKELEKPLEFHSSVDDYLRNSGEQERNDDNRNDFSWMQ